MSRLDSTKLVSNATRIWDKRNSLCQLPRSPSWWDSLSLLI